MASDPHATFCLSTPPLPLGEGRGEGFRAMPENKEAPVPGTAAKDGRREFGAKNGETPAPINRKRLRKGFRGARSETGKYRECLQA